MNLWKLGGIAAFVIALGLTGCQESSNTEPETSGKNTSANTTKPSPARRRGGGQSLVVVQPVTEAIINDRLKALGNGKANASVAVVPLSNGLLSEVLVKSGQRVEKGDLIALLDNEEQLIARDRAARTAENAAIEEARLAKLYRSRTVTEAELIRSRADLTDATLALREAELRLERRRITAPIAGIVGLVPVSAGNYVTNQTEVVTIDDRSSITVAFWVPERFASQIKIGQTIRATAQSDPSLIHTGQVSGVDSRIESSSRTLPVEAELPNNQDTLRPGMSFNLELSFTGNTYPAVDPLAIQWDSNGSYVWLIEQAKAQRVAVRIMQRNPESVLVAGDLSIGDKVVTEGLLRLRPGAKVRIEGSRPPASGDSNAQPEQRGSRDNPGNTEPEPRGTDTGSRPASRENKDPNRQATRAENENRQSNPPDQNTSTRENSEQSNDIQRNQRPADTTQPINREAGQ